MRTTQKDLAGVVATINEIAGGGYRLGCAYGAYRLEQEAGAGVRDISPRLPAGQMYDWLWAFVKGWEAGEHAAEAKAATERATK